MSFLRRVFGGIFARLLLVNVVVLLVPSVGLEFARIHERQLLRSLERDMRNQAILVREVSEDALARGATLDRPGTMRILVDAARQTRTRVRILDADAAVLLDSHAWGPPEGPEPPAPTVVPQEIYDLSQTVQRRASSRAREEIGDLESALDRRSIDVDLDAPPEWLSSYTGPRWPALARRREVRDALRGQPGAFTRVRDEHPSVILFITEPIRHRGEVRGVVYVTRSTQPVLEELYKIRSGLLVVQAIALALTALVTLILALSISRPLGRLSKLARRIAAGERGVSVDPVGSGEIRELSTAVATMTRELDARMKYISDFAADVAHEFKSPLTSIKGAAELLAEGAADDPRTRERFLSNIQLDAERLERLVSRLLELSRIDASREPLVPVDLRAMLERVAERTHTEEQPVVLTASPLPREFRGREGDLERAALNLVENALRFGPPHEAVRVDLSLRREGSGKHPRDFVELAVWDQGPGVPLDHRARLFERFFTTDAERDGTGLGLAIVRSVAEAHGGQARLDETYTQGARFVMSFPLGPELTRGR